MDMNETTETTVTTRVIRPFKIIALILLVIATILLIPVLASYMWIKSETFFQGLFMECYRGSLREVETTPPPNSVPFECYAAQASSWLKASRACVFISFFLSIIAFVFALVAIIKGKTFARFFLVSGIILITAGLCILVVLIIFPVKFMVEEVVPGRGYWELGWAWGIAFGVLILQLAAGLLFIFAPDKEEIFYSEKTYYH